MTNDCNHIDKVDFYSMVSHLSRPGWAYHAIQADDKTPLIYTIYKCIVITYVPWTTQDRSKIWTTSIHANNNK